jgi:hypothetical protein
MRQEEIWDAEIAQSYDTPGARMFTADVLNPTVDRLAELAANRRALEFAIGSGRVAVPLSERGISVTLESRNADWAGAEFTADSPSHVSVYRLAN